MKAFDLTSARGRYSGGVELVTRLFLIRPPRFRGQVLDQVALSGVSPLLERLGRRKPALLVGSAQTECEMQSLAAIARLASTAPRIEPGLDRTQAESIELFQARVLKVLDQLSREFMHGEVLVVLHADGIRAALARALCTSDDHVFAPEPGQAIALDWAHPEAREFQHALIGMAIDWEVAPAANKVHRFPGGASVLPRPS